MNPKMMHLSMNRRARILGFTLLELVISIAIFSIISTASAYFIRNILLAQERGNEISMQLNELQKVWSLLQRDIEQAAERAVRDQYGEIQQPFIGDHQQMAFSRIGWPLLPPREMLREENSRNKMVVSPRSEVLRIRYYIEEEKFMRAYWSIPDQAENTEPQIFALLNKVNALKFQYVFSTETVKQQTSEVWPPDAAYFPDAPVLPRSVKVTLTFDRYGELYRWFQIPDSASKVGV